MLGTASVENNLKIGTSPVGRGHTLRSRVKSTDKFGLVVVAKARRDTGRYFISYLRLW